MLNCFERQPARPPMTSEQTLAALQKLADRGIITLATEAEFKQVDENAFRKEFVAIDYLSLIERRQPVVPTLFRTHRVSPRGPKN
jgi:hypothetical protein